MRAISAWSVAAVTLLGLLVGCRAKNSAAPDGTAFVQAAPEIKQAWDEASAADRTNGYVPAQMLYYSLSREQLTLQQSQAVVQASAALNERLLAALKKGDTAAQAALAEMRRNPPNRPH